MTDLIAQTLRNLAIESGELPSVGDVAVVETLPMVLEGELMAAQEPALAGVIAQSDVAEELAVQLDNLADRADLVPVEEATVVQLSAESLNREFSLILRAAGMEIKSESFEKAESDLDRLKGLSKDARAFAAHSRKTSETLMDHSQEGVVGRFLRSDVIRLHQAKVALQAESAKLRAKMGSLNQNGVAFSHSGIAKFLTQENKAVTNIRAGISSDSAYLDKVRGVIDGITSKVVAAANSVASGSAPSVDAGTLVSSVTSLNTADGALMGNYSIKVTKADGPSPKISRSVAKSKFSKTAAASAAIGAAGVALVAFGTWGVGAAIAGGAVVGSAIGNYKGAKHAEEDTSKMYSSSSAADLEAAVKVAEAMEQHITFKLDWDTIGKAMDAAESKLTSLEGEDKAKAKKSLGEIMAAMNVCVKLADVAYEQAIYDIVNMATVLKAVGSHMKTSK